MSDYVAQDNGTFPYDWHRESVGNAFDLQLGKMLSKASKTGRNARHYLGNKNVQWDRLDLSELETMDFTESEQEKFSLRPGDLLVCEGGEVGRTAMWKGEIDDCYYQKAIHRLRPKSGTVEAVYMLQFMRLASTNGWFTKYTSQSSIAHLTREKLAVVPISFPPLPEQRKIARVLTTVDNLIEQTEALIEKYKSIKQGMMHDLFTRGVDSTGSLRPPYEDAPHLYKQSPLGWIPKEWEASRLGNVLKAADGFLQTGPFGSQLHAHEYVNDGIPVIMPQDIIAGRITIDAIARITEAKAKSLARHRTRLNDIVFSRRGDLSRATAVLDHESGWLCGTGCFLLRVPSRALDAQWLSHIYRYPLVQRQVDANAVGSTMPSLNNAVMANLLIPFPSVNEQKKVRRRLDALDRKLHFEQLRRDKMLLTKHGLMQDLLTGKVRVNVDEAEEVTADV